MNRDQTALISKVADNSILFVAVMGIPINIITYFALLESQYQLPRYIPILFEGIAVAGAIWRKTVPLTPKLWGFIALLFGVGCYNLLLGLIDMASLWFVLAIIYALFIAENREALYLFAASFGAVLGTGILMMTKATFIPLQYNFESCQFACVAIRIIHFLLVGTLTYYILETFYAEICRHLEMLGIQSDVLEKSNRALETEIREKKVAQQQALEAVVLTEERERKRIAADLHDGLGPELSAINLFFQAYIDATDQEGKVAIEKCLKAAIDSAINDVSRVAQNISPHVLEKFGFAKALESFISKIGASREGKIDLVCFPLDRFDLKRELALYRTLTELVHNTIKHAGPSDITIRCVAAKDVIITDYHDNGRGFHPEKVEENGNGMGLANMRNRLRSLGGTIALQSAPLKGMVAQIRLPMADGAV